MPAEQSRIPAEELVVIDRRRNWSSSTIHNRNLTPRCPDRQNTTGDFEGTRSAPPGLSPATTSPRVVTMSDAHGGNVPITLTI
jgi:hypothetical protein